MRGHVVLSLKLLAGNSCKVLENACCYREPTFGAFKLAFWHYLNETLVSMQVTELTNLWSKPDLQACHYDINSNKRQP